MHSKLGPKEAAAIYRLECPTCSGALRVAPLMASEHGEPERFVDDVLICGTCELAWTLKRVTEALIAG